MCIFRYPIDNHRYKLFSQNFCCQSPCLGETEASADCPVRSWALIRVFHRVGTGTAKLLLDGERGPQKCHICLVPLESWNTVAHSPMPSCLHARFSVLPGLEESRMTQAQYIGVRWQMENMRVHFMTNRNGQSAEAGFHFFLSKRQQS